MPSLLPQLAIVAGIFALRAMTSLYWRTYIQPSFDRNGGDAKEYAKRKNSGQFFQIGVLVLMLLFTVVVHQLPRPTALSVEVNATLFFLILVSFCFNFLGVGNSIRYLKEKNIEVTPFGKAVLVMEDAPFVFGMIGFHYMSFRVTSNIPV